ncbi:hypothetical protein [Acetobacter orientalis]|uniref:Uncharacterized protein n=1 Tax=Acetobacter orientalis TaxID=146474 RepID=A0A251ZZW7_9PROT|nr:hypothetical protein [Acetobacter orientalis]OUI80298.1 hypothetical protein HK12_09240 [Acetobacter orientalis]
MGKVPQSKGGIRKNELLFKMHLADQRYDLFRQIVKAITWITCIGLASYFLSKAFGQSTHVDVSGVVTILGDLKFTMTLTLAGACAVWAIVERYLRKRVVKKLAPYKQAKEKTIDPNRTSSTVAPDGTTHRRDRRE